MKQLVCQGKDRKEKLDRPYSWSFEITSWKNVLDAYRKNFWKWSTYMAEKYAFARKTQVNP